MSLPNTDLFSSLVKSVTQPAAVEMQTPYALMDIGKAASQDAVCLILPASRLPELPEGPDPLFEVTFDGISAAWTDAQGRIAKIGSQKNPLDEKITEHMASTGGMLVLFQDENTAMPVTWAICKVKQLAHA